MDLTRIQRKRATDEVYEAIRQAILTHLFKPGERLQVDEDLTQASGVSLTPVRQALQQLATGGFNRDLSSEWNVREFGIRR